MRTRSLLKFLTIALLSLGAIGCGSSTDSFVVTSSEQPGQATSNLTFNFVAAQSAFTVDAATTNLRFEFFESTGALGESVLNRTVAFSNSVVISNVPVTVQSFRITSLGTGNIPLAVYTQDISLAGGGDREVTPVTVPVPVSLVEIFFVPASVADPDSALNEVRLPVGGTGQVYLLAEFSNGDLVVLGNLATYSLDPSDPNAPNILEVGEFGQLRGLAQGQTTLLASYAGQDFTLPVIVGPTFPEPPIDDGGGEQEEDSED